MRISHLISSKKCYFRVQTGLYLEAKSNAFWQRESKFFHFLLKTVVFSCCLSTIIRLYISEHNTLWLKGNWLCLEICITYFCINKIWFFAGSLQPNINSVFVRFFSEFPKFNPVILTHSFTEPRNPKEARTMRRPPCLSLTERSPAINWKLRSRGCN